MLQTKSDFYVLLISQKIANDAKCAVMYVIYSLSPEVKLPVAFEETYDAVVFATDPETAKTINVDPTRIAIGGDSAGGNLSAGVSCKYISPWG